MDMMQKYIELLKEIPSNKHKYIHSQSLYNFINQLSEETSKDDLQLTQALINEYISIIKDSPTSVDSQMGLELFQSYINPIGEGLKKYGFKRVTPMKYLFLYSVMMDSLIFLAFLKYPFPIISCLVGLYYYLFRKKRHSSKKAYGLYF